MAEVMKLTTKGGQGYLHNRKALDCVCLFLELLGNVHNRDKDGQPFLSLAIYI